MCENYQDLLTRPVDFNFVTVHFENGVPVEEFDDVGKKIVEHFNIKEQYHFCCISNDNVANGFMIDYDSEYLTQLRRNKDFAYKNLCE
jgi:hypothetical protein